MSTPAHSLRLILALVFTAAAIPKILDPAAFTQSVAGYQLLPDALVRFTVLTLPWLEVLLAILLVCQVCTGPALFLTNLLLAVFLAALGSAHLRGLDVDCGCFGSSAPASMTWYLIRDVIFLTLGLAAAWLYRRENPSRERTVCAAEPVMDTEEAPATTD